MSWNKKYSALLAAHPLATKSITTAVLAFCNEQIAMIIAKDVNYYSKFVPLNEKIVLMAIYGGIVNAPISHYSYKLLNRFIKPVGKKMKLLQLLVQLATIAPLLSVIMISYITLINNLHSPGSKVAKVKAALKQNLLRILKTSWFLNCFNVVIAQNFLRQELWVVFFNFNFFILGTYQNTLLKLRLKDAKDSK